MKVEVLVSTMSQTDRRLPEKMNIQTDAIVINQTDCFSYEQFTRNDRLIKWYAFAERGIGLSRNTALMRASADIVLFADDDVVYEDEYEEKILRFYKTHPDADVVIFNFKQTRDGKTYVDTVTKTKKVGSKGVAKYGTVTVTARTAALKRANLCFHREFGGGTRFGCGEDTLFLQDCVKKGLRVYTCAETLGRVDNAESTWFNGYTEKYFFDKGALFYMINRKACKLIALYHCFKHRKRYAEYGWKRAYKTMKAGIQCMRQEKNAGNNEKE